VAVLLRQILEPALAEKKVSQSNPDILGSFVP
jgi:hypothetical protein